MGYFTETIALFEFNGDAEKAYAARRDNERKTNSHASGKYAYKLGVDAINSNQHSASHQLGANGNAIVKDKRLGDNPSQRMGTYTSMAKQQADKGHKYMDKAKELSRKYHEPVKACKESVIESFDNAFAGLLEPVEEASGSGIEWKYKVDLKDEKVFAELEKSGLSIPGNLKSFVKKNNGATPSKYKFKVGDKERVFGSVLSFNKGDSDNVFTAVKSIGDKSVTPFAVDSFGNYICLKGGKVVFWDHETGSAESTGKNLSGLISSLY